MTPDGNDPGSQRQSSMPSSRSLAVWLFLGVLAVLVLQAIIHENFSFSTWPLSPFWKLNLLKVTDALKVSATVGAALVAWQQVRLNVTPRLMYFCRPMDESDVGLTVESGKVIWRCGVKNVGAGAAIINRCSYWISFSLPENTAPLPYTLSYLDAVSLLREKGLEPGRDYGLMRYTGGAVIGSQVEQTIFEAGKEALDLLRGVDVKLEYQGVLGGRYEKEVFAIPRAGIKNHVAKERLSKTFSVA